MPPAADRAACVDPASRRAVVKRRRTHIDQQFRDRIDGDIRHPGSGAHRHALGEQSDDLNALLKGREATHQQNMQNRRKAQKNSRSELLGVGKHVHGKTYYVRLQHNGNTIRVGGLRTEEDARRAYLALKREFHEACTI